MKKLLTLSIAIALFASCKKDSSTPAGSKESILTSKKWKITASTTNVDYGNGVVLPFDLFAMMPACQQDNIYSFLPDHTTLMDEGALKCDPSDPQQTAGGSWQLVNNETQLQSDLQGGAPISSITADILQLDNNTLKIKYTTTINGPVSETTTTYTSVP